MLFGLLRWLPRVAIRGFFWLTDRHRAFPGPIAALLREVQFGVKGVVMTLYYSDIGEGRSIHGLIGWDARVGEPPGAVNPGANP